MGWRYKAGLFLITAVVIIWVSSAEVTQVGLHVHVCFASGSHQVYIITCVYDVVFGSFQGELTGGSLYCILSFFFPRLDLCFRRMYSLPGICQSDKLQTLETNLVIH